MRKVECKAQVHGFALSRDLQSLANPQRWDAQAKFLCITPRHSDPQSPRVGGQGREGTPKARSLANVSVANSRDGKARLRLARCGISPIPHGGAVDRIWILNMTCASHTHVMRNPFAYQVHVL